MKLKGFLILVTFLASAQLYGQKSNNTLTDILLSSYSERAYVNTPVTQEQLNVILRSGIKAPSSVNSQPWKFTVIQDEESMRDIVKDVVPGNALIVISGVDSQNGTDRFDLGLATQSMYVAAHALGLGARIYGSPVKIVNSNKDHYQIPTGYTAAMVLRVGNVDKTVDAVSSASPRKTFEEVVNYRK